jgi:hypothetical protein
MMMLMMLRMLRIAQKTKNTFFGVFFFCVCVCVCVCGVSFSDAFDPGCIGIE